MNRLWLTALCLVSATIALGILAKFGVLAGVDRGIFEAIALREGRSANGLISAAQAASWVGDGSQRAMWLILFGGLLAWKKQRRAALIMIVAPVLAAISSDVLKAVYDRPRPALVPHLDAVNSMSFPSGHATSAAAIAILAALLLPWGSQRLRIAIAIAATLTIGLSRPMLGVHWPSDVLAGWMLGLGFALGGYALARKA